MRRGVLRPLAVVLALLVAWELVAPVQLGGRVSYVNVRGISMEPTLSTGDLMVMRRRDAYEVGQIVAFESDMGGAIVVHRIVDVVGDRHLLKGDNNAFLDRYTPTVDEIIGAEVITIPGGERLADLASATPTVALQSLMLLVTLWVLRTARREAFRQRRAARRRRDVPARTSTGSDATDSGSDADGALAAVVELER
jgi:signal peptidase I